MLPLITKHSLKSIVQKIIACVVTAWVVDVAAL